MPELPDRPPERFQFSLKHLFLFTLVSAFVALGLRQLVFVIEQITPLEQAALLNAILCVLALVALFYFFFRAPYVAVKAESIRRRWQDIQAHRRQLEIWTRDRRAAQHRQPDPEVNPPNED